MIAKRDEIVARTVLDRAYTLPAGHFQRASRLLNIGLPLAELVVSGQIAKLTPDGRDTLQRTADLLGRWLAAAFDGRSPDEAAHIVLTPEPEREI